MAVIIRPKGAVVVIAERYPLAQAGNQRLPPTVILIALIAGRWVYRVPRLTPISLAIWVSGTVPRRREASATFSAVITRGRPPHHALPNRRVHIRTHQNRELRLYHRRVR